MWNFKRCIFNIAMGLNYVFPQFHMLHFQSNVMALGDGTFGRHFGLHEVVRMGLVLFEGRPQRACSLSPPTRPWHVRTREKVAVCEPGREPPPKIGHAGTLILDF